MTTSSKRATMRAATIIEPGCVRVESVPIPKPGPGQVRVRLEGCGVSPANVAAWTGDAGCRYPMEPGLPGSEGWGIVDAIGEGVNRTEVGDRVAILSSRAYAEYDIAQQGSVVRLPPALGSMPFPGDPIGCAISITRRSDMRPRHTVAIVGIGFLGALLTRTATLEGARVIAVSRRPCALEVALAMGASATVSLGDPTKAIEEIEDLTEGALCDVVIDAAGRQLSLDLASELTRDRGRLVIAGLHDGTRQVNMQLWNQRGIDIINANDRDERVHVTGIRAAADAVVGGLIDPSELFTHSFPLDDIAHAFTAAAERPDGYMKSLVLMS